MVASTSVHTNQLGFGAFLATTAAQEKSPSPTSSRCLALINLWNRGSSCRLALEAWLGRDRDRLRALRVFMCVYELLRLACGGGMKSDSAAIKSKVT